MTTGLYSGSFDPFTNGHLDVLRQALNVCEKIVIAIGRHATKTGTVPFSDRAELVSESLASLGLGSERWRVVGFDGLVVDAARNEGATVIVRGVRDAGDLPYEMQMAAMNAAMAPDLQTVFVPAAPASRHVTATLVRQIDSMGGDVKPFVPDPVLQFMMRRRSLATQQD